MKKAIRKIYSGIIFILQFISSLISMIAYSRLSCYVGGVIIWSIKGFRTNLKDEIANDEYNWNEPYYKRFKTPSFVGFLAIIIMIMIIGCLLKN